MFVFLLIFFPGKYTDGAGNVYDGYFLNNVMHGPGLLSTRNGFLFDGEFVYGVKVNRDD